MKLPIGSLLVAALSFPALSASAAVLDLGVAGQFNAFIFNDFIDPNGRVDGALAVGNNLNVSSYSINQSNQSVNGYGLVVGNHMTYNGGDVFNGNLYAGGTISTSSFSAHGGSYGATNPVDFASEQGRLNSLSQNLSLVGGSGSVEAKWGGLYLTASNSTDPQVFNLDGADFSAATYINFTGFQANQTIILNISGISGIFNGGTGNFGGYNALFNFYEATTVDTTNSAYGSLLAPLATITGTGTVFGNVIANNWNAGTVASTYFQATDIPGLVLTTPVPEPETLVMLLAGWGLIGLAARRKRLS